MKSCFLRHRAALTGIILACACLRSSAVLITNDTLIRFTDTTYDGQDVAISNCTVTIDGTHVFSSLQLLDRAVLTHTYAPSGVLQDRSTVSAEPQVLTGTNANFLASSNVLAGTVVVQDQAAIITYTNGQDYTLDVSTNQLWLIARTTNSSIPDGATVLVSYDVLNGSATTGLRLDVTGAVQIAASAVIRADGKGYLAGTGLGGTQTGTVASGGGGGHGGYGGLSSSNAPGGQPYGILIAPDSKGSGGGNAGGIGGGYIRVAGSSIQILGALSANGGDGTNSRSGGGSGGSVWLSAPVITGSGSISVNGGKGEPIHGGGGSGGRIALETATNLFDGTLSARGGDGFQPGAAGTVYIVTAEHTNGLVTVENGFRRGAVTAISTRARIDVTLLTGAVASIANDTSLGELLVRSNAWLTAPSNANLVDIAASDAVFEAGAGIDLNGLGYPYSQGQGAGAFYSAGPYVGGGGAGHGGYGGLGLPTQAEGGPPGTAAGGNYYDSLVQPNQRGSGGGGNPAYIGGAGGGALKLNVSGSLLLDGAISVDGLNPPSGLAGAGAGGSIWLTAGTLSGSGRLSANGGSAGLPYGGGGSGGRIAVYYGTNAFTGTIAARGGLGFRGGAAGTIFFKDQLAQVGQMLLDNGGLRATNTPLPGLMGADLIVQGGAIASSLPSILGKVTVRSNSAFVPAASVLFCTDLTLETGGSISADGLGFGYGQGPSRGVYYSPSSSVVASGGGGGHGGAGGSGYSYGAYGGGATSDQLANPTTMGSGGGGLYAYSPPGSLGGGVVQFTVTGTAHVDGKVSASGTAGIAGGAGGGAGGSVILTAYRVEGSGSISADGGAGHLPYGGGGGGGRIAVNYTSNLFTGSFSAKGGAGYIAGGAGTIYLKSVRETIPHVIADNGGLVGTNTVPYGAGTIDLTLVGGAWISWGPLSYRNILIGSNSWLTPYYGTGETWNISGNVTVEAGGAISADGLGNSYNMAPFSGSYDASNVSGGGGASAGYGGAGLTSLARGGAAASMSDVSQPQSAGYPGGVPYTSGQVTSVGGGALRLDMSRGTLTVNGRISANGTSGQNSAGGAAGGSLWINAGTLAGTGIISANGGNGDLSRGGGGGGGRVALYYTTNRFSGQMMARGGAGYRNGGAGTVYIKAYASNFGTVTVDNNGLMGTNTALGIFWNKLTDLTLRNGAVAAPSPPPLNVLNCLIESKATLVLSNFPFTANGNLTIARGGRVTADGAGYPAGQGPGYGTSGSGGNHGGLGGGNFPRGSDNFFAPATSGSGGGNAGYTSGGSGGGNARLDVKGMLTLDGEISANGSAGGVGAGGGAGGSVYVTAGSVTGTGTISANGGPGGFSAGGGGGGMVALVYRTNLFGGLITAYGGAGSIVGGAGTIYLKNSTDTTNTPQLLLDNGGQSGALTLLANPRNADVRILHGAAAAPYQGNSWWANDLFVGSDASLTAAIPPVLPHVELAVLNNAIIEAGGRLSLNAVGYGRSAGPGAGQTVSGQGSGGGYGGPGGASATAAGGSVYGSADSPADSGSGGGAGSSPEVTGSQGGGVLRLTVAKSLTVNGSISADGNAGLQDNSGGGSGGSLWLTANRLEGTGQITAAGGPGELYGGGGGGGGRIALYLNTNAFLGLVSAQGGWGYSSGGDGTIYASSPAELRVLGHSPVGTVSNAVSSVSLQFSSALALESFTAADVELITPLGPVPASNITVSVYTTVYYGIDFPPQTAPGDYLLRIGPDIQDLVGSAMSQVYTGGFTISMPVVQGTITQSNGAPVPGVLVLASGSGSPYATDPNGLYSVGAPPDTTFSITPTLAGWSFVPGTRWYTNVTENISSQDFLAVTTLSPVLSAGVQGQSLALSCFGIPGVAYQLITSSNLVDWVPAGECYSGTNGPLTWIVPTGTDPSAFFRVNARN